ncbi:PDR/VanB family oxidoreductase [Phycicoccus sp. Soil802]|uniref:PDR/VanB family oxidoreductase n=1 Tax=Phycicoccus sp. Soil802 TaxID=1736414 RepID=UPI0007039DD7|nr:PDR/VanB family oxidoreductase [Phycicoccus sp. Soil802]KRF28587.1 flavodoxin [Phycicoccus sp. Soil802]
MTSSAQPDWCTGRVVATAAVARDVKRITIQRPARGRAAPGSHLDVRVQVGDATDVRSYSVVESDDRGSLLTISVLRLPQSRGGSVFMHSLAPGDELQVTQPLQNFPLSVAAPRHVLLAGGIGITAVAAMARVLRAVGADYTLVYVGRSRERMAYVDELAGLHGDRLVVHVDAEQTPLDAAELVGSIGRHPLAGVTELYMCGPIRLMDAVRREWEAATLPSVNLRFETFGSSGWFRPEEFVVSVPERQIETTVGTDETVLEALIRSGVDLMYDCRKGECGLCVLDVDAVDGVLDHRDVFLSASQKGCGRALSTCVSRVVATEGSSNRPRVSLTLP